jgi:hypothetical protein
VHCTGLQLVIYNNGGITINFANISLCHNGHFFPPLIVPRQPSLSNSSPTFFLTLLLPHLTVTLFPTLPFIFNSSSPHYSTPYQYDSLNPSSPFLTLLLPILFSMNLPLLPLHLSFPFSPCSVYKKNVTTLSIFSSSSFL